MNPQSIALHLPSGLVLALLAAILFAPAPALAQMEPQGGWSNLATRIETDGSLGPQQTVTGVGSVYTIGQDLGTRAGNNLFHSFRFFDLGAGDTGRFTGSASIENIVSRITGGEPSYLNGKLESQIADADFYFLNPSGVFFGPGASLDVPAAFYTSTAQSLGFSDGQDFATEAGAAPVLSMATPDSFGFFGQAPIGRIGVDESELEGASGHTLALVGGDIDLEGALIETSGGGLSLVGIGSAGEVAFDPATPWQPMDTSAFATLGDLRLSDAAQLDSSGTKIRLDGNRVLISEGSSVRTSGGGEILITAAEVIVTGEALLEHEIESNPVVVTPGQTQNLPDPDPEPDGSDAGITITAGQSILISGGGEDPERDYLPPEIRSVNGGAITIDAPSVVMDRGAIIHSSLELVSPAGEGGVIRLLGDSIRLSGSSQVISSRGRGLAGAIVLDGGAITIDGGAEIAGLAGFLGQDFPAVVSITARDYIHVRGSGEQGSSGIDHPTAVKAVALGHDDGGAIRMRAPEILIEDGALVSAAVDTPEGGSELPPPSLGSGGNISLQGQSIEIRDGAALDISTNNRGNGGQLNLLAERSLQIDDGLITGSTFGEGQGGAITLEAPVIDIRDGGAIRAVVGPTATGNGGEINITASKSLLLNQLSEINTSTEGAGNGGNITIRSPTIEVRTGGTVYSVAHAGSSGNAGDITIDAKKSLSVTGTGGPFFQSLPSFIGAATLGEGHAGDIQITAPRISIADGSTITALSLSSGSGNGGNIDIVARDRLWVSGRALLSGLPSRINASTDSNGNAGNLDIRAGSVRVDNGARILSGVYSTATGHGGDITIRAREQVLVTGKWPIGNHGSAIDASTTGPGAGGSIDIRAPRVRLEEGGEILAASTAEGGAGQISVAANTVRLSGGSRINVQALQGAEPEGGLPPPGRPSRGLADGNIAIHPEEFLLLEGDSFVAASVRTGLGGSIEIGSPSAPTQALILRDGSAILAQAVGGASQSAAAKPAAVSAKAAPPLTARGGDIAIYANTVLACPGCPINADGPTRNSGGSVVINNPETALEGQVMPPTVSYLDASSQLLAECGRAPGGNENDGGRFRVARWQELPLASEGPLLALSPLGGLGTLGREQAPDALPDETTPPAIWLAQRGAKPSAPDEAPAAEAPPDATLAETRGAVLLNQQGHARALAGDGPGALARYRASAEEARASGQNLLTAQAESNAARTALALGEPGEAKHALSRARLALEQALDVPSAERTALLLHLAESEFALARLDPASRSQALLTAHGDLLRAQAAAERSADPRASAQALGQLGALYAGEPGRAREARYLTRRALQFAETAQAADLLARFYAQLGQLEWQSGQTEASLDAYRRAVGLLEETRPEADAAQGRADLTFRQNVEPVYLALVDHLLASSADAPSPAAQQERLGEARRVVEHWKAAELRNYFRDSCAARLVASAQAAESLDPRAAVVYPIALPDRLELLVSRPSGIVRVTVPVALAELRREVHHFRSLLAKRVTYEYEVPAKKLHTWLVDPYLPLLEGEEIDTLVFVPSGVLRTIPMAALHDGDQFLVERYAVAVTPSLDLLAPKPLDPEETDLLLVGVSDPVQGYPGLPGVKQEIAAVEALYGGKVLLNEEFDPAGFESALRNDRPGIVHLASHAEFTGDPESSFVLTHDDRLSMEELAALVRSGRYGDEPVELLLLSACETAVGDERAALGLAGVSIRAGARSAMGSLWSVSDDAASKLVVGFYEELGTSGTSKAQALQRSQKKLLATPRFQHPYYWAPFLVMNNWL